jgi:hypothetical protein
MGQERFKRLGEDSFFGRMVYDRVIPRDHFLMRLNGTIPWQRFTYKLVKYYRGGAKEGSPPWPLMNGVPRPCPTAPLPVSAQQQNRGRLCAAPSAWHQSDPPDRRW